jgi:Carboxypeptidase regulatory-like domain
MKMSRPLPAILLVLLIATALFAGDKSENKPQSSLSFVVLKDDNGKPVRNAAVVLHPVGQHGKQAKGGFELKTDPEGKTHFDGIPYGAIRIQVIAPGFQTFGNDYEINQQDQEITVRLKRPQGQYSIYEKHDGDANGTAAPPPEQKP